LFGGPGGFVFVLGDPGLAGADFYAVGGPLGGEGVGHQGVADAGVEAEGFPTVAGDGDDGALAMGEVAAEDLLLDRSIGMEDEVVDRAAFDEYVGIVRGEPVEVVDGAVAGEHVINLALDLEGLAVDLDFLGGVADDA